jgi:hypothetical protein
VNILKKLLLNRKPRPGPWGGGNLFTKAICSNANRFGYNVVFSFEQDIDAILMLDPRYDELGISINEIIQYKEKNPKVRIIHRVNECDARKGTNEIDSILVECSKFTDVTIFVSNWMKNYFLQKWYCKNNFVIYNGVEKEYFHPRVPEDKTGYSDPINIVAHHWSNNELKGFDIYDKIDEWISLNKEFKFTYIGRDRGTFKNSTVISPLFGAHLGTELRKGDVYISASRFDPGPNHIIEALALQIPVFVHIDGGGAVEFAGSDSIYSNFDELSNKLKTKQFPNIKGWDISWEDCVNNYFQILNRE